MHTHRYEEEERHSDREETETGKGHTHRKSYISLQELGYMLVFLLGVMAVWNLVGLWLVGQLVRL